MAFGTETVVIDGLGRWLMSAIKLENLHFSHIGWTGTGSYTRTYQMKRRLGFL